MQAALRSTRERKAALAEGRLERQGKLAQETGEFLAVIGVRLFQQNIVDRARFISEGGEDRVDAVTGRHLAQLRQLLESLAREYQLLERPPILARDADDASG